MTAEEETGTRGAESGPEEDRTEMLHGIKQAGPETTVGRVLLGRLRELNAEITKVRTERNNAIRSLLIESNPSSAVSPVESERPVPKAVEQRGASGSHGQQPQLATVGGTSIPGRQRTTVGGRLQTYLSERDLAAIAHNLQNPPQQSQDSNAREETSKQLSSEFTQPRPAPLQTNTSQPSKKINPQGLRAKIDRRRQGRGGYINADILREIVDYGRQIFRQGMEYFDWAMKMLRDLGEQVGPYLKGIFEHLVERVTSLHRLTNALHENPFQVIRSDIGLGAASEVMGMGPRWSLGPDADMDAIHARMESIKNKYSPNIRNIRRNIRVRDKYWK